MFKTRQKDARILLAGICALIVGMGAARFSFTAMLPNMLTDFLNIDEVSILSSLNYFGYLLGALCCVFLKTQNSKILSFKLAFAICLITTLILAVSNNQTIWLVSRILAGIGSAIIMVIGSAFVFDNVAKDKKKSYMGIYFSGVGFSILLTSLIENFVFWLFDSWRNAFFAIFCLSIPLVWYSLFIFDSIVKKEQKTAQKPNFTMPLTVKILIFTYFIEGMGFVVQATYLPDIINSVKGLDGFGKFGWYLVGVGGIFSVVIWMKLAEIYGSAAMIIAALLVQAVGIAIPVFSDNLYLNLISGFLYGGTMVGLTALFMNNVAEIMPDASSVMGALTTAYGLGQIIAPIYCKELIKIYGSYDYSLLLTAVLIVIAALILFITQIFHTRRQKCHILM